MSSISQFILYCWIYCSYKFVSFWNLKSLSFTCFKSLFIHFYSLSHTLPFVVTRCIICCDSFYHSLYLPLVVICCSTRFHSLSLVVPLVVTCFHSLLLDVPLVSLFVNVPAVVIILINDTWKEVVLYAELYFVCSVYFCL